jgi:hypothetical protein
VAQSAASVTLLAANATAKFRWIYNDPSNAGILYVRWNASPAVIAAAGFTGVPLRKGEAMFWSGDEYNGEVRGIWSLAGGGVATITETT